MPDDWKPRSGEAKSPQLPSPLRGWMRFRPACPGDLRPRLHSFVALRLRACDEWVAWHEREVVYVAARQRSDGVADRLMRGRVELGEWPAFAAIEEAAFVAEFLKCLEDREYVAV